MKKCKDCEHYYNFRARWCVWISWKPAEWTANKCNKYHRKCGKWWKWWVDK